MTEKKEIQKCMHISCNQDAVWKGTSTKESISQIKDRKIREQNMHLFKIGIWHYCDKHKKIVEGYNPHLQFEAL